MNRQDRKQQIIYPANVAEASAISVKLEERGISFTVHFSAAGGITIRLDESVRLES